MAVYLLIPKIDGGATEEKHAKWIALESMTFGVSRNVSMTTGHATGREAALPNLSEVHVSKEMDMASIELFGWSVAKYDAKTLKIDVVTTGRDDPFIQYTLENAVISGYSVAASAGNPQESISLSFTKMTVKFTPVDETMKAMNPVNKTFDIATGRAG